MILKALHDFFFGRDPKEGEKWIRQTNNPFTPPDGRVVLIEEIKRDWVRYAFVGYAGYRAEEDSISRFKDSYEFYADL